MNGDNVANVLLVFAAVMFLVGQWYALRARRAEEALRNMLVSELFRLAIAVERLEKKEKEREQA